MRLVVVLVLVLTFAGICFGEDSKETLILKKELAQEKSLRIQFQMQIMEREYKEGQETLKKLSVELNDLDAKIKAIEGQAKQEKKK